MILQRLYPAAIITIVSTVNPPSLPIKYANGESKSILNFVKYSAVCHVANAMKP